MFYFRIYFVFLATILALFCGGVYASGFRLPEQSLNGTALNSAYIAGAYGADSTYYNPANMGLMKDSEFYEFEIDGSLILIPAFSFDTENRDKGVTALNMPSGCARPNACPAMVQGRANTTLQPVPKIFFKSRSYPMFAKVRGNWGISLTTPSGLSMDWDGDGGGFLDDVSIAMLEFNPVVSLAFGDYVGIGAGFRAIYSFGSFNNTLYVPYNVDGLASGTTKVEQTSNGSGWGFGYNVALSLKPFAFAKNKSLKSTTISATYRSNVYFNMGGTLSALSHVDTGLLGKGSVNMDANLNLYADLPPILNVGISQDFGNHRVEFVYERTFYGNARIFEFGYSNQVFHNLSGDATFVALGLDYIASMVNAADYSAVAYGNGWKDASAYRLGYTYFGSSYKIMASLAYDETPAPQGKFGIPDANAYMIGFGGSKRFYDDKVSLGFAYSLALKDNRQSFIKSRDGFGQLHIFTIAAKYLW